MDERETNSISLSRKAGGTNILLVVFCGLPASGKSTICELLKNHFQTVESSITISHLEYDEILESKNSEFEQEEEDFVRVWAETRKQNIDRVHELVKSELEKEEIQKQEKKVILIDDNMYYRSMRRKFYNIAADYGISFCQIVMKGDLEFCVAGNKERNPSRQVKEEVIERMVKRIEYPNPTEFSWENPSFEIDLSKVRRQTPTGGCQICWEFFLSKNEGMKSDFSQEGESCQILPIWNLLLNCLESPLESRLKKATDRAKDREANDLSLVHTCDKRLRLATKEIIQQVPKEIKCDRKKMKECQEIVISVKTKMLDEFRATSNQQKKVFDTVQPQNTEDPTVALQVVEHKFKEICLREVEKLLSN